MISVYCIDDSGTKYEEYARYAQALGDLGVQFEGLPDDQNWQRAAHDSLKPPFVFKACTRKEPSFILLDIKGVHSNERFFELKRLAVSAGEEDPPRSQQWQWLVHELTNVADRAQYGSEFHDHGVPFFVCTAARTFGHKVILFSSAGGADLPDVNAFQSHFSLGSVFTGRDSVAILRRELQEFLAAQGELIDRKYLRAFLRRCLDVGFDPEVEGGQAEEESRPWRRDVWTHSDLDESNVQAVGRQLLGLTDGVSNRDLKALLELEVDQSPAAEPCEAFICPVRKPISRDSLRAVVAAMQFPCKVEVQSAHDGVEEFRLPMQPGFLFVIGLWRVVRSIENLTHSNQGWAQCKLCFDSLEGGPSGWGPVFRVRLILPNAAAVDHIYRYLEKTVGVNDELKGLSLEIENLAWGRIALDGLPQNLTVLPVAKRFADGRVRKARGTWSHGRVAALSLGPGEIAYYWT